MKICIKKNGIIYLGELLKKYPLKPAAVEKLKMELKKKKPLPEYIELEEMEKIVNLKEEIELTHEEKMRADIEMFENDIWISPLLAEYRYFLYSPVEVFIINKRKMYLKKEIEEKNNLRENIFYIKTEKNRKKTLKLKKNSQYIGREDMSMPLSVLNKMGFAALSEILERIEYNIFSIEMKESKYRVLRDCDEKNKQYNYVFLSFLTTEKRKIEKILEKTSYKILKYKNENLKLIQKLLIVLLLREGNIYITKNKNNIYIGRSL